MINNNLLANRLNAFKSGKIIPEAKNVNESKSLINESSAQTQTLNSDNSIEQSLVYQITFTILRILKFGLYSLVYGYSANIIFSQSWNFYEIIAIGIAAHLFLSDIFNLKNKSVS